MASFRSYVPAPPLSAFVREFALHEGGTSAHAQERVLPHGTMQLLINLREDVFRVYDHQRPGSFQSFRGCLLSGTASTFAVIDTSCLGSVLSVQFRPGGAFPFFGLPVSELHDRPVSLDVLWGTEGNELRERVLAAKTLAERFHILEQALLAHAAHPWRRHPAVAFALREFQTITHARKVSEVTEQIGLSPRRFIQAFSEEVGLTPKLYCRIRRFQEALLLIEQRQERTWTDVALACGYFDQAHLIHDFQTFAGINPTTYRMLRGEYRNHVPLV